MIPQLHSKTVLSLLCPATKNWQTRILAYKFIITLYNKKNKIRQIFTTKNNAENTVPKCIWHQMLVMVIKCVRLTPERPLSFSNNFFIFSTPSYHDKTSATSSFKTMKLVFEIWLMYKLQTSLFKTKFHGHKRKF